MCYTITDNKIIVNDCKFMLDILFQNPLSFLIYIIFLLVVVTIHEFSHAYAADRLGDPTPGLLGRVTLNPIAHLDPIGSILFLIAGFGWGKPVPFDPFNLKHPKKDSAVISFAGPFSNLAVAVLAGLFLRFLVLSPIITINFLVAELFTTFIRLNILLAVFNLIPVHPLDGFRVVAGLLPQKYYNDWLELERYGMIFLIFLIFPFFGRAPVFTVIGPVINFFMSLLIPSQLGGVI